MLKKHPKPLYYVCVLNTFFYNNTMISFSAFKIHKFKKGCRMKYDCQDSLKIEQIKNLFVQGYDYYYRIFNIDCIHKKR